VEIPYTRAGQNIYEKNNCIRELIYANLVKRMEDGSLDES
jgi:hypothetical protein